MSRKHVALDRKRGRHKKRVSRETKVWEEQHLIPPPPSWMNQSTYVRLAKLRAAAT